MPTTAFDRPSANRAPLAVRAARDHDRQDVRASATAENDAVIVAIILLQAASPQADDIVVVGNRKCDLSAAGDAIRGKALDARAAEWRAGRPVIIVVPAKLRTKCLAKVMFRLQDRGVTKAVFVDGDGSRR